MFNLLMKNYRLSKAFKKLFFDEQGNLKPEGAEVLSFLRDEAGIKGELSKKGRPYLYDEIGRFDAGSAGFLLGRQRMFRLIVKYLSLDEIAVFNLIAQSEKAEDVLIDNLEI